MGFSYKPLWKTLIDKDMKPHELMVKADFTTRQLTHLNKNEPINLKIIESICHVLDCRIQDVIEITPDKPC